MDELQMRIDRILAFLISSCWMLFSCLNSGGERSSGVRLARSVSSRMQALSFSMKKRSDFYSFLIEIIR